MNSIAKFETSKGSFKIELFEDKAPITTENFITLAKKGFYDGQIFHRVIAQFHDPGRGTPRATAPAALGYTIPDEFHPRSET